MTDTRTSMKIAKGYEAVETAAKPLREEAKLRKAAEDFEGLLLARMLQSIRESALGGWQENHDQGGAVALEMAETQLAQVMASQGGLGIARTLTASMGTPSTPRNPKTPDGPDGSGT